MYIYIYIYIYRSAAISNSQRSWANVATCGSMYGICGELFALEMC